MTNEQQLTLLEIEPPPFAPAWPNRGTLAHEALTEMLGGHRLTHLDFIQSHGSWRLAATIATLKALGWPIKTMRVPLPAELGKHGGMSTYMIATSVIEKVRK